MSHVLSGSSPCIMINSDCGIAAGLIPSDVEVGSGPKRRESVVFVLVVVDIDVVVVVGGAVVVVLVVSVT